MQGASLKELSRDGSKQKIVVRLSRIWECKNQNTGVVYELAFVAVDHEGNVMEGNVRADHMKKFREVAKEGSIYTIQGFLVKPARPRYTTVDNHHRITISQFTKVQPTVPEPQGIPLFGYSLQPLSVLQRRYDNKNIVLSDITGVVTELTGLIYSTAGGQPRRNIKIKDIDENEFTITLWGNDAEDFDEERIHDSSANGNVCMLFLSMAASMYRENMCLKFTSLTRYYIDADIPETTILKRKYGDGPNQINWQQIQTAKVEALETTLFDLAKQEKDNIVGKHFKIAIEIVDVDAKNWWYWACKTCVKSTKPTGKIFTCTGENCSCIEGNKRFIINASAKDINFSGGDEEVIGSFAFFGPQGRILTGCVEDPVVASAQGKTGELPPEIANVIGRKYLVTGRVTQDIYAQKSIPFRVSAAEMIGSLPMLPKRSADVNLVVPSEEATASFPEKSASSQPPNTTPPKEVVEDYESDAKEDPSSAPGKRNKKARTTASSTGRRNINKNLFPKK